MNVSIYFVSCVNYKLVLVRIIFIYTESDDSIPVFLLHATLLIPKVTVLPTLDEVQDSLITAGRYITAVSKGVGQWTGGKPKVIVFLFVTLLCMYIIININSFFKTYIVNICT